MGRRAANGQGSLFWSPTSRRWELAWHDADGKRWRVTGRTQAEAQARAAAKQLQLEGPQPVAETVGQFLDRWATEVLPSGVAQSTAENYANIVRLYLIPHLGTIPLASLTPADVRGMLTKVRSGRSSNTTRLARSVLRRALRTAEADGVVSRNVAGLVDGVRVTSKAGRTLTPDEARLLLRAAEDTPYHALIVVLLSLGLRKGEALGLTWDDIQLLRKPSTLTVHLALRKDKRGATYLAEPKTKGSARTVHLPGPVVDVLRRHRDQQAGGRFVFTSSAGSPLDPDRVNRAVQDLTERAGLGRWTPHELRHSAASLLIAQGVPLKVVSETLGHSSIRVTADVYGHLMEPAKAEAAEAMTAALWG